MLKILNPAEGFRAVGFETKDYKTSIVIVSMAVQMDDKLAANAILMNLLKRSCKDYPNFTALNAKLDDLYGAALSGKVTKNGDAHVITFYITGIDDRFSLTDDSISAQCVELLAGMIFKPNCKDGSFGEENLAREKRLLIQHIQEENDDKRLYAYNKCIEYLCRGELYAKNRSGTVEEIENLTMADVYAAWQSLLEKAHFQITAVGSQSLTKIVSAFKKYLKKTERHVEPIHTKFSPKPGRSGRHEEQFVGNQSKLVIGFRTGMTDAKDRLYEYTVMNDVFGGGTYSGLFSVIREKMSLAYYCRSRLIASKGLLMVEAGIDTDKEKNATAEMIKLLNDIRTAKISDELIADSKRSLKEGFTLSTPESIAGWYDSQILFDEITTPEEAVKGVEAVTKESIQECAKQLAIGSIFMLAATEEEEGSEHEGK